MHDFLTITGIIIFALGTIIEAVCEYRVNTSRSLSAGPREKRLTYLGLVLTTTGVCCFAAPIIF